MKYSFLLPAYKSRFLEQSLRSILSQTYTDFNVIVSDDCSPEDIKSIVDKFSDSRVTYRRNEKNIGAGHLVNHWNLLLGLTDAEYVIMASDDDVYGERYLEEIEKLVREYPNVCVFRTRMSYINENGEKLYSEPDFSSMKLSRSDYADSFAKEIIFSGMSQHTFKRSVLVRKGGFVNFPAAWFSDDATVLLMSEDGIALSDNNQFSMRASSLSISTGKQSMNLIRSKVGASVQFERFIKEFDIPIETQRTIRERTRRTTLIDLKKLSFPDFITAMHYCGQMDNALFPSNWRIRKILGHIYYDYIKK